MQARTRLLRPPRPSRRASGRRDASPALALSSTGLRLLFAPETPRSLASGMFIEEQFQGLETDAIVIYLGKAVAAQQ